MNTRLMIAAASLCVSAAAPAMAAPVAAAHDHVTAPTLSMDASATLPVATTPDVMPHMAGLAMSNMGDSSATLAFKDANARMHTAMDMTYSEDADVDFVRVMIAHHQGAVDMANAVLKYGSDPDVRMLAGDIVKAQEKEIDWMRDWLTKHGPRDLSATMPVPAAVMDMPAKIDATADGMAAPTTK